MRDQKFLKKKMEGNKEIIQMKKNKYILIIFVERAKDTMLECTVERGDVLYLPSFWWHEVQSSPDEFGKNIAVNFWYHPVFDKEFPCANCSLHYNYESYASLLDLVDH